jgi:hypothetical protein
VRCSRKRRLCSTVVAAGRSSFRSSSRSLPPAFSSSFGGLPRSPSSAARGSPSLCRALLGQALERGEANVEQAGSLGLGGPPTIEGGHYLLAEVFGVGFHPYMISSGSTFLINAVVETYSQNGKQRQRMLVHLRKYASFNEALVDWERRMEMHYSKARNYSLAAKLIRGGRARHSTRSSRCLVPQYGTRKIPSRRPLGA